MQQNREPRVHALMVNNLQQRRQEYTMDKYSLLISDAGKTGQLHVKECVQNISSHHIQK